MGKKPNCSWSIINYDYFTALLRHTNIYIMYADSREARARCLWQCNTLQICQPVCQTSGSGWPSHSSLCNIIPGIILGKPWCFVFLESQSSRSAPLLRFRVKRWTLRKSHLSWWRVRGGRRFSQNAKQMMFVPVFERLTLLWWASVAGWSEAADVREALQLLWEVVFVEHWVCTVFHHFQGHCTEHWCKLVDALRPKGWQHNSLMLEAGEGSFSSQPENNVRWSFILVIMVLC